MNDAQSATSWYVSSGHGPSALPMWHEAQRRSKMGATSGYRGLGSGHSRGAVGAQIAF